MGALVSLSLHDLGDNTNMTEFVQTLAGSIAWRLCAAIACGLVLGIERERRKSGKANPAGLRTFTLIAFLGGLAAQSGLPFIVGIVVLFTATVAIATYRRKADRQGGVATEVALVIAVVLGVLAQTRPGEALAASVVAALVISNRIPLHRFARERLTEQDMRDALVLSVAGLVVLPLLPNSAIDPLGLINPFALWRLAVVLMGVSAASYYSMRLFGPRFGLPVSGFAGGFVSSTAVIAAMGGRAKQDARMTGPAAAGAAASVLGSLIFLIALVGAADPAILRPLVRPFLVGGILLFVYALGSAMLVRKHSPVLHGPSRAFDVRTAMIFAGLVAVFSLISWAIIAWFGQKAIFASVIATALIDAHAAAVSIATLVASNRLDAPAGAFAILVGFSANMIAKAPTAFALGPWGYGIRVTAGLLMLIGGLWVGYAWSMLLP
jgi:uncharacterized membrane protein (DUF4010 family)